MGKNDYYENLFESNYEHISKNIAALDAYAFFKVFFPDYKIQESRYRTLLLDSSVPKNNGEQIYKNLVYIFNHIKAKDVEPFLLTVTEVNDLVRLIFKDVNLKEKVQYRRFKKPSHSLLSNSSSSMREKLEELIQEFEKLVKEEVFEPLILHLNFIVDFMNMEIYTSNQNEMIGILIFYILMTQQGLIVGNYVSFFAKMHLYKEELFQAISKTKFQWEEGLSEVTLKILY
jgi:hypothetical protein